MANPPEVPVETGEAIGPPRGDHLLAAPDERVAERFDGRLRTLAGAGPKHHAQPVLLLGGGKVGATEAGVERRHVRRAIQVVAPRSSLGPPPLARQVAGDLRAPSERAPARLLRRRSPRGTQSTCRCAPAKAASRWRCWRSTCRIAEGARRPSSPLVVREAGSRLGAATETSPRPSRAPRPGRDRGPPPC